MTLAAGSFGERGFTLVEMLVALLLLSLVGLSLAQFQTFQLGAAARISAASAARLEADNRAVDLMVAANAPTGMISGTGENAGRTWFWSATPKGSPDPATLPGLVTIDVAVRGSAGGPPLAVRQIVRPQ